MRPDAGFGLDAPQGANAAAAVGWRLPRTALASHRAFGAAVIADPTITSLDFDIARLSLAVGIGLLIGAERERRKGEGAERSSAGLRTFAMASLAGQLGLSAGGLAALVAVVVGVSALAVAGHWRSRSDDPGMTTEVALVVTTLLGAISLQRPALAAGGAVITATLLAMREPLHRFVRGVLTGSEIADGLVIAGATLVVLPLLPDRAMGPFGAFNPHALWLVVVLVMAIGAMGHAALRFLGARFGLATLALASGFISSIATIAAMGARARQQPAIMAGAAGGALLSTLATTVQLAAVLAVTSSATLVALAPSLVCAGLVVLAGGASFTLRASKAADGDRPEEDGAFNLASTAAFGATLATITLGVAMLKGLFGETGALAAAAIAGFVDTHASAASIAALVAAGKLAPPDAVAPILAALTTNTLSKIVVAASYGRAFAVRVIPGLIAFAAAAWVGAMIGMPAALSR